MTPTPTERPERGREPRCMNCGRIEFAHLLPWEGCATFVNPWPSASPERRTGERRVRTNAFEEAFGNRHSQRRGRRKSSERRVDADTAELQTYWMGGRGNLRSGADRRCHPPEKEGASK